jgi:hypothetical protein
MDQCLGLEEIGLEHIPDVADAILPRSSAQQICIAMGNNIYFQLQTAEFKSCYQYLLQIV